MIESQVISTVRKPTPFTASPIVILPQHRMLSQTIVNVAGSSNVVVSTTVNVNVPINPIISN
jgi:hypothetical protein